MAPDPNKKRFKVHLRCPACGEIFDDIFAVPASYPPEKVKTAIKLFIQDRFTGGRLPHKCAKKAIPEIIYIDEI